MLSTYEIVMKSVRCVIIVIGVFSNLLSFVVFTRPTFKKNSISTYGQALAISDLFILFDLVYELHWFIYQTDLPSRSDFACKLFQYFSISFMSVPGWIIAAFSVDKLLNMKQTQLKLIGKKSFQRSVIVFIYLFNLVGNLEFLVLLEVKPSNVTWITPCFIPNMPYYNYFIILIAFNLSVVPVGVMTITAILIIKKLRRTRIKLGNVYMNVDQRRSREFKFAVSSLTFNFLYIILRLPMIMSFILAGYGINVGVYVNEIAFLLFYANSSATLLIHLASNSIFRHELILVFKRPPRQSSNRTKLSSACEKI